MKKTRYKAHHRKNVGGAARRILSFVLVLVTVAAALPLVSPATYAKEAPPVTESESPSGAAAEEAKPDEDADKQEDSKYANSISGMLWLDVLEDKDSGAFHGDGIRQQGEQPLADYTVSLYKAEDKTTPVENVKTEVNATYIFENLEPGSYVVGISTCIKDNVEYLLPLVGMSDNTQQFSDYNDAYTTVYSKPFVMEADTVVTDINAGMRTPMDVQPAANVGIQPSKSNLYVRNQTKIGFGGKKWWVIGDSSTSTPASLRSPSAGSVTLLSDRSANFGTSIFNPYTGAAGNNDYNGSTLQSAMTSVYNKNTILTAKEKTYVVPRPSMDLQSYPTAGNYGYANPTNQNFWPLSAYEYDDMGPFGSASINEIRGISTYAWLRSPGSPFVHYCLAGVPPGSGINYASVNSSLSVRPAFYFDLSSALFSSVAATGGASDMKSTSPGTKNLAKAGTPNPSEAIKLTMEDDKSKTYPGNSVGGTPQPGRLGMTVDPGLTDITSHPDGEVSFSYSGAQTGTGRSVSVMICNKDNAATDPGKIRFYGRPVNCSSGNASGTATFTLPSKDDLPIGDYTLKIFNEEVNGVDYTDYASVPQEVGLHVREVEVSLSANPDNLPVYYTGTTPSHVDLTATVKNHLNITGTTIQDAQWIRVPISNTTDYSAGNAFDTAYTSTASANKGTLTASSNNNLTATFPLQVDKNATYWFKGTVRDPATSLTYTNVSSITVDNLYKEVTCKVQGINNNTTSLYGYETIPGQYGIPFDLDGTTPLAAAPSLGFDTIALSAKTQYIKYGSAATKSGQPLTQAANTATVTLDGTVNADCDSDYTKYTIFYTMQKYLVDRDDNAAAVGTYATLQAAVNACVSGAPCTITATEDDVMATQSAIVNTGQTITLTSDNTTRTIKQNYSLNGQVGRHIQVKTGATLTLKNIILKGSGANYGATAKINGGVAVTNGTLIMDAGSVITKCQAVNGKNGGGIIVQGTSASLTMNGDAKIVDNTATPSSSFLNGVGGGVFVDGGTVKMDGNAAISNNTSQSGGGGVFMNTASDIFEMNGGKITDNTAANAGGGIYKRASAVFTMNAGEISGNNTTGTGTGIAGHGGGIHADDWAQVNPASPATNFYKNLYISSNAKVENNTAGMGTYAPPSNYTDFSDPSIRGGTYTFDGLLLDNNNIGYRNPNYVVTYDANNGGIGTQKYYQTTNVSTGNTTVNAVDVGTGTGEANFTAPANHVFAGWTENNNGTGAFYRPGNTITLTGSKTLYAKWETSCEVSISKTVTGAMGDKTRDFTFKITFENGAGKLPQGTQFDYTGGIIPGTTGVTAPAPGTLTLDGTGSATVPLKHGQCITIEGVPLSSKVTIEETDGTGYTTKYIDSANPSSPQTGTSTGQKTLSGDRTFAFENNRGASVPGGFGLNSTALALLIGLGVTLIGGGLLIKRASRRAYRR